MARIDDDIVAKASFYAGLSQTYAPEEVPADIRTNGNSLLRDIVNSVCNDEQVDRGDIVMEETTTGRLNFDEASGLVPKSVIYDGKKLTVVGLEDYLTTYKNNTNVCCIYHSVVDTEEVLSETIVVDEAGDVVVTENGDVVVTERTTRDNQTDVITVATYVTGTVQVICDKAISIDETAGYLRVDCRKAVKAYIVDYLSYAMAGLYQMATEEKCGNKMLVSYNQCKKKVAPALMLADPMEAYKRIQHANGSPNYGKGRSRDALRGE